MMKNTILAAMAAITMSQQAEAQVYAYATGIHAGDSVVYVTDIHTLDNAQLTKRTKFLVGRQDLSAQFRNYLAGTGAQDRTCAVVFNKNRKKLEKDFENLMGKLKKQKYVIMKVEQKDFQFIVTRND